MNFSLSSKEPSISWSGETIQPFWTMVTYCTLFSTFMIQPSSPPLKRWSCCVRPISHSFGNTSRVMCMKEFLSIVKNPLKKYPWSSCYLNNIGQNVQPTLNLFNTAVAHWDGSKVGLQSKPIISTLIIQEKWTIVYIPEEPSYWSLLSKWPQILHRYSLQVPQLISNDKYSKYKCCAHSISAWKS